MQNILQISFTCVNRSAFLDELRKINWYNIFDHSETADPRDITYDATIGSAGFWPTIAHVAQLFTISLG